MENRPFNSLVEQFLNKPLPDRLAHQISFTEFPFEAQSFVLRLLTLMKRASFPATDFTPYLMRAISFNITRLLPSTEDDYVPPITMPGRHHKLDALVTGRSWPEMAGPPIFLDLGCGFPPLTTLDAARNMPDWNIVGVDRSFSPYIVYDPDGHWACFNHHGKLQYYQTQMNAGGRALNDDPKAARTHFKKLFSTLFPLLEASNEQTSTIVEKDGNKLIYNHIHDFKTDNLNFVEAEIINLKLPPARAIRCMNVLIYFKSEDKVRLLSSMGKLLHEGGMLIAGFNYFFGSSARYTIYQKAAGRITPGEFAFSLDNLRPIGIAPWYTIHSDDAEAAFLADLLRTIRADEKFWPTFNRHVDDLLDHLAVCRRGNDGFLNFPETAPLPEELIDKMMTLWKQVEAKGFTKGAVKALDRAGYRAWINPVGDIAVQPPTGSLPTTGILLKPDRNKGKEKLK